MVDIALVGLLIGLALFVFSIYMAVDAYRRVKNVALSFLVVLLILFTSPLGAIIWYFVRKKK